VAHLLFSRFVPFCGSVQAIQKQYHHNWIIDNLPAASILDHDEYISTQFVGYPIGTRAVFGPVFNVRQRHPLIYVPTYPVLQATPSPRRTTCCTTT
jgi:hypothetical protein